MAKKIISSVVFLALLSLAQQSWQYYYWDRGYRQLRPGMSKDEVVKIMGNPTSQHDESGIIDPIWDGNTPPGPYMGKAVHVTCYLVPLALLKRWCLGFNREHKLVSRWEPVLD